MAKVLFSLFMFFLLPIGSAATEVDFAGLSIQVPDSLSITYPEQSNNVIIISSNAGMMCISTYGDPEISEKVEFDIKVVFEKLHTMMFNLEGWKLDRIYNNTSEMLFPLRYVTRFYSKPGHGYVTTRTFYTPDRPYVAAVQHTTPELPAEFVAVIDATRSKYSRFGVQWQSVKDYWFCILFLACIGMVVANIIGCFFDRKYYALKIAIAVSITVLSIFLFIYPSAIMLTVIAAFLVFPLSWLSATISLGDLLIGVLNELT